VLLEIRPNSVDHRKIDQVVSILRKGGVIAIPTDTVYSFACDIHNKGALKKLAKLKGVKLHKANFSLVCEDLSQLSDYTKQVDRNVFKIMNRALPGPYTFILNASNHVPKLFDSKKKEIGIRIPDNDICKELVISLGNAIAVTSIHDEDEILEYTNDPYQIFERFETDLDCVIDGGLSGLWASTVIDCTSGGVEVIREGIGALDVL